MIIVTGGLGFIGNEVVRLLSSQYGKEDIAIIDNLTRKAENIEDIEDVTHFNIDINEYEKVNHIIRDLHPKIVIHLAATHFIPDCNSDPIGTLSTNVNATLNLFLACKENDVKHFLFASSGAVYADYDQPINEEFNEQPVDIYGYSKLQAEKLISLFSEDSMKVSICRLFNNYGPRETNPHILPEIVLQLRRNYNKLKLGTITSIRDYVYTQDTAQALQLIIHKQSSNFEVYNIGSGQGCSVEQIIKKVGKILNRDIFIEQDPAKIRKVDKKFQVANIDKIKELGYKPVDLDSGLEQLLRWERLI